MKRIMTSAIVGVVSVVALGACASEQAGSQSDPEPEITTDGGPDQPTPDDQDEQEVIEAVEDYYIAFLTRGDAGVESAVEGRLSKDLAAKLIPDENKAIEDADLAYIGEPQLEPEDVTIDGDKATFTGCQDNSEVFVVPAGDTTAGVGSRSLGISDVTVELVREGGRWLIDLPTGERVDTC